MHFNVQMSYCWTNSPLWSDPFEWHQLRAWSFITKNFERALQHLCLPNLSREPYVFLIESMPCMKDIFQQKAYALLNIAQQKRMHCSAYACSKKHNSPFWEL
jgi:hypothetical protein